MFEKNNDFEKWWSEHDYSEFHKYDCLDAFNAGEQNGYNKAKEEQGDKIESSYREGVAFGKDKANEWHYPSKGEYPTTEEEVLVYLWDSFYIGAYCLDSSEINRWHFNDFEEQSDQITAWRYIEPPKEEE